jgi:flagellin
MSGSITLTAAMRANLLSLQTTGTQLSTTQLALSTGNKVNSALDNPVNYFAAQSLNRRASQLSSLLDGMGQAVQTIQATNNAITSITGLVNQLTSITNSAVQDLNDVTSVNSLETSSDNTGGITSGLSSSAVNDISNGGALTGQTFTLAAGVNTGTFAISSGETLQQLVDQVNGVSGFNASIVYGNGSSVSDGTSTSSDAQLVGQAYLRITSTNGQSITATDSTGTTLAALGLASSGTSTATSAAVQTGGDSSDSANFNDVLKQINALVTDSNYSGNNLISGSGINMTVQVNELSTTPITINNVDLTTAGNPDTPGSTGLNLGTAGQVTLATTTDIADAVAKVNAALSTLQAQASSFANGLSLIQNRQDFTTNLVNTLQNGASDLTIADKNQEGAELLALQTQQQLGIEALSLSSQANQSVLRLFG